jgi:hypothetical protein
MTAERQFYGFYDYVYHVNEVSFEQLYLQGESAIRHHATALHRRTAWGVQGVEDDCRQLALQASPSGVATRKV